VGLAAIFLRALAAASDAWQANVCGTDSGLDSTLGP